MNNSLRDSFYYAESPFFTSPYSLRAFLCYAVLPRRENTKICISLILHHNHPMPRFTDITHILTLAQSRSRGDFATAMDRELGYSWDGTLEGKITLIDEYFMDEQKVKSDKREPKTKNLVPRTQNLEQRTQNLEQELIPRMESTLLPILAVMEYTGVRCDAKKLEKI